MLAWSDDMPDVSRNHGCDVIVGELFTDYSITLANLSRKPKTQINRRRTLPTSFRWWDAYRNGIERLLSESQDAVAIRRLKVWRFYDWSCWYPSGNRPLRQYLGFLCQALVMVSSSIRPAWLQNSSGRGGLNWCMSRSPRLSPLWLSASSSAVMGC